MGRTASIDEQDLIERLAGVFREVGYEGTSLSMLSEATGLKRASLYHRFPGGKAQMAEEVLLATASWVEENILLPLRGDGTPQERIAQMIENKMALYDGGRQACPMNLLAIPTSEGDLFTKQIGKMLRAIISSLAKAVEDAGLPPDIAKARAERATILTQGALVVSRGLGTTRPFREVMADLPGYLLAPID